MVEKASRDLAQTDRALAGPLFLVGMPRSGTKLLREMLNQHPRIRLSDIETDFFPYWESRWARLMPAEGSDRFNVFHDRCLTLPFFVLNAEKGIRVDCDEWRRASASLTPAAVFEGLMRCCLGIPAKDRSTIWGDKSPSYIRHIPLLIREFPNARVIHIIRDARDYALSIHDAWGKSILRAVQRWQDDVWQARRDGKEQSAHYIEVRYEDLLAEPRTALEAVCAKIGVDFDERMVSPGRIVENKGAGKTTSSLLQGNTGKYRTQMTPRMIRQIERIAGPTLRDLGYECDYQGSPVRVPSWELRILQLIDGWNVILAGASRFGLIRSIRFSLKYFIISGNRR